MLLLYRALYGVRERKPKGPPGFEAQVLGRGRRNLENWTRFGFRMGFPAHPGFPEHAPKLAPATLTGTAESLLSRKKNKNQLQD